MKWANSQFISIRKSLISFKPTFGVERGSRPLNTDIRAQVQLTSLGSTIDKKNKMFLLRLEAQCMREKLLELSHIDCERG